MKYLKFILENFLSLVNIKSLRTRNITKHVFFSFFYQGGSIIISFLLVPLTIDYLDAANYGLWLVLTSFISWFSFFDIGLGNGLRNKFAEAKAKQDISRAQNYVSTAYFSITVISLLLISGFLIANVFIDWTTVFNVRKELGNDLSLLVPIVMSFFCLQLVVKLITTIYLADQKHSAQIKIHFITQLLSLVIVWLLTQTSGNSLLLFGSLYTALPVVILIVLNFVSFSSSYNAFRPIYSGWRFVYFKDIMNLGLNFFVIQISSLVLLSTDNFIIINLFSPEEVVEYNLAFKYFSILIMLYSIIISPYWSSFSEAYAKKDLEWIKLSVKNIQKIWLIVPILLLVMVLCSDWFYFMWVGERISISLELSIIMAIYVAMTTFNMIYINFINGIGKIKLQVYTAIITMVINIPMSIFFAKTLNMGVKGVMIATCLCAVYSILLRPIQYYKIINNKAKGIWNK